jgi:superfamily I DNA/RNA helicase
MKIMEIVNKYIENEEQKGSGEDFLKAVYDMIQQNKNLEKMLFDINGLKETIKDDNFTPEIVTDFIPDNLTGEDVAKSFIQKVWEELQRGNAIKKIDEPSNEESTKGHQFLQLLFKKISEDVRKPEIGRIHVTTYRKAKGLEADLVIVASVDSNDFFNNPQKRRLLYVATTRSKKNLILTFADKRSGARRFTRGRSEKFKGVPKVYRSPLIPSSYNTQVYSETWLENWEPI